MQIVNISDLSNFKNVFSTQQALAIMKISFSGQYSPVVGEKCSFGGPDAIPASQEA